MRIQQILETDAHTDSSEPGLDHMRIVSAPIEIGFEGSRRIFANSTGNGSIRRSQHKGIVEVFAFGFQEAGTEIDMKLLREMLEPGGSLSVN
jgi:hypothetical protein